jgi:hypothetical protein
VKRLILLLGLLLVATTAQAASQWHYCGAVSVVAAAAQGAEPDKQIVAGEAECFYFNAAENSAIFRVEAVTAVITLNPNVAGAGADNAEVMIRKCMPGVSVYDANRCHAILDASLDGTVGASGTQNMSIRVGRGRYVIVNTTSANTQEARVSVEGE